MEVDSAKALSPKGVGLTSCSWAGPTAAPKEGASRSPCNPRLVSATKQSHANSNLPKGQTVPRKDCGGAATLRSRSTPWHVPMLGDGGAWNFKRTLWLLFCLWWPADLLTWLQGGVLTFGLRRFSGDKFIIQVHRSSAGRPSLQATKDMAL